MSLESLFYFRIKNSDAHVCLHSPIPWASLFGNRNAFVCNSYPSKWGGAIILLPYSRVWATETEPTHLTWVPTTYILHCTNCPSPRVQLPWESGNPFTQISLNVLVAWFCDVSFEIFAKLIVSIFLNCSHMPCTNQFHIFRNWVSLLTILL